MGQLRQCGTGKDTSYYMTLVMIGDDNVIMMMMIEQSE